MTPELFVPENTSPETLLAAFDTLFEATIDDDGEVVISDKYRVFVALYENKMIHFESGFRLQESCSEEEAHALCNRINTELIVIRAKSSLGDHPMLFIDWYLPIRGGIAKKTVVRAIREFIEILGLIGEYDSDNILI
jgi:hypothetical protein